MDAEKVQRAVDKASKANIGIVAMKTQGGAGIQGSREDRAKFNDFSEKGFKKEQAAIKAVLTDERIQVVVSEMTNRDELRENIGRQRDPLTPKEARLLEEHRQRDGAPLLPRLRPPLRDRREGRAGRDRPPLSPVLRGLRQA